MAKDEFIGIRVSKEFKDRLKKSASNKGVSIAQYIESSLYGDLEVPKRIVESMIVTSKENNPKYWKQAEKSAFLRNLEWQLPMMVSDYISPQGNPRQNSVQMAYYITDMYKTILNNIEYEEDINKQIISSFAIESGKHLANDIGKLKVKNKEDQEIIIKQIKEVLDTFIFNFTAMGFAKNSYEIIKKELDKTEKQILNQISK